MTDQPAGRTVATRSLLDSNLAYYYRAKADECGAIIDDLNARPPRRHGCVEHFERERALWTQLADELDAYLHVDDDPGLF